MIRFGCALVILFIIGIPILALRYLPTWGALSVIGAEVLLLVVGGPKLIGWGIKRVAMRMFSMKSRVLRGAKAVVHEVTETHKPLRRAEPGEMRALEGDVIEPSEADEEDSESPVDRPSHFVRVLFTLKPALGSSRMQFYDPHEIELVPYNMKVSMNTDPHESGCASPDEVKWITEEGEEEVEGKLNGESKLAIVFACPASLRGRVKFRYYFESFGDFMIPS